MDSSFTRREYDGLVVRKLALVLTSASKASELRTKSSKVEHGKFMILPAIVVCVVKAGSVCNIRLVACGNGALFEVVKKIWDCADIHSFKNVCCEGTRGTASESEGFEKYPQP
eukprot:6034745-Amphidinium_carterae.1